MTAGLSAVIACVEHGAGELVVQHWDQLEAALQSGISLDPALALGIMTG